ncbi:hypothetical protein V1522DRAFT_423039 [Lipomyces starkeyi]
MLRANDDVLFYCFSCSTLNVVLESGDQYGFVPNADEEVQLEEIPKLNWDGPEDSSFNDRCRLYVLDAPMGAGKTHVVREHWTTTFGCPGQTRADA